MRLLPRRRSKAQAPVPEVNDNLPFSPANLTIKCTILKVRQTFTVILFATSSDSICRLKI